MSANVKRSRNFPKFVRPTVLLARFITNLFLEYNLALSDKRTEDESNTIRWG